MPASPESYRLAQTHRRQQLEIRSRYMAEAAALWPLFTRAATREDIQRWLRVSATLIHRYERLSWSLANVYYNQARNLDAPNAPTSPPKARFEPMPNQQIVRNLLDRGPGTLKRAKIRGVGQLEAEEKALANTLGSGGRMVLHGGRAAINKNVKADRVALGWMRVTDGDPCYFCAALASRGAVYESEATAGRDADSRFIGDGNHKFHDHCGCQVAPAFTRDEFMSDEALRYRDLWKRTGAKRNGSDALNAFRRALEGREEPPKS